MFKVFLKKSAEKFLLSLEKQQIIKALISVSSGTGIIMDKRKLWKARPHAADKGAEMNFNFQIVKTVNLFKYQFTKITI
ncbi:MAG: hypothetical protein DRN20_06865 [Thermoplasmata archaeon]|nr:MAG: hypothetical protein DRN20_06865 [Thermoplasmata archaeon]